MTKMSVLIFKNFLSKDKCDELNSWVELGVKNKWLDVGTTRESGFEYKYRLTTRNYGDRFEYPTLAYEVFDKISNVLGLRDVPKSVAGAGKDGIVVSYTLPGGDVYEHTDTMEGNLHVLRCNIMTQAAEHGAALFIDRKEIKIEVGDLHCYLPSAVLHSVTEVKGNTPRILWMFGYQISKKNFSIIEKNYRRAIWPTQPE